MEALNEPRRVKCGAPDFQIFRGRGETRINVGYIETKDIDVSLDEVEKSDQLKRYRGELDNLILTDYLEFRWFVEGKLRETASLGRFDGNCVVKSKDGLHEVGELLTKFLTHQPEPIGRAADLAVRMAKLTKAIKCLSVINDNTTADPPRSAVYSCKLVH